MCLSAVSVSTISDWSLCRVSPDPPRANQRSHCRLCLHRELLLDCRTPLIQRQASVILSFVNWWASTKQIACVQLLLVHKPSMGVVCQFLPSFSVIKGEHSPVIPGSSPKTHPTAPVGPTRVYFSRDALHGFSANTLHGEITRRYCYCLVFWRKTPKYTFTNPGKNNFPGIDKWKRAKCADRTPKQWAFCRIPHSFPEWEIITSYLHFKAKTLWKINCTWSMIVVHPLAHRSALWLLKRASVGTCKRWGAIQIGTDINEDIKKTLQYFYAALPLASTIQLQYKWHHSRTESSTESLSAVSRASRTLCCQKKRHCTFTPSLHSSSSQQEAVQSVAVLSSRNVQYIVWPRISLVWVYFIEKLFQLLQPDIF